VCLDCLNLELLKVLWPKDMSCEVQDVVKVLPFCVLLHGDVIITLLAICPWRRKVMAANNSGIVIIPILLYLVYCWACVLVHKLFASFLCGGVVSRKCKKKDGDKELEKGFKGSNVLGKTWPRKAKYHFVKSCCSSNWFCFLQ